MTKNAALTVLAVSCIFLLMVPHTVSACMTLNRLQLLQTCQSNLNSGRCEGACRNTLAQYKNENDQCVCQHIQEINNSGFSGAKAKTLIQNCKFRPWPKSC